MVLKSAVFGCLVLLSTSLANAGITVFVDDRAGFDAIVSNQQVEDFSDATLLPGVSFTSNTGSAQVNTSAGRFDDRVEPGTSTTFNFATPIFAFGGDFDLAPGGQGLGLAFSIDGPMGPEVVTAQVPETFNGQFFGFTSMNPILSVTYTVGTQGGAAETFNLDNLVFSENAISAVPEPSSLAMLGLGATLGAVRVVRRRKGS